MQPPGKNKFGVLHEERRVEAGLHLGRGGLFNNSYFRGRGNNHSIPLFIFLVMDQIAAVVKFAVVVQAEAEKVGSCFICRYASSIPIRQSAVTQCADPEPQAAVFNNLAVILDSFHLGIPKSAFLRKFTRFGIRGKISCGGKPF